jgi:hypothetical protein
MKKYRWRKTKREASMKIDLHDIATIGKPSLVAQHRQISNKYMKFHCEEWLFMDNGKYAMMSSGVSRNEYNINNNHKKANNLNVRINEGFNY